VEYHESWTRDDKNVRSLMVLEIVVGMVLAEGFRRGVLVRCVRPGEWNPEHWSKPRVSETMRMKYRVGGDDDAFAALMIAEYADINWKLWKAEYDSGKRDISRDTRKSVVGRNFVGRDNRPKTNNRRTMETLLSRR